MKAFLFHLVLLQLTVLLCYAGEEACTIPVLSVDHAFGEKVTGQYFNFNREHMSCLTPGKQIQFLAYNPRTSTIGEVVVWGGRNGGSVGDSHGRFNYLNVRPAPGQWQRGDTVVPIDCSHENTVKRCSIPIVSVDHKSGKTGQYFNFDRKYIKELSNNGNLTFQAYNLRTGQIGEVIVWGSANGGTTGDSHGRFNSNKVAPMPGQWRKGDRLYPVDQALCL
ncbi:uncharacterized protein [Clytia hemisphaerica]|uniref:Uncharacterized protein n=1 Tax=Clytia hemisphaerica TaxID=252671 RepID=A0A7M5UTW4_9CNID